MQMLRVLRYGIRLQKPVAFCCESPVFSVFTSPLLYFVLRCLCAAHERTALTPRRKKIKTTEWIPARATWYARKTLSIAHFPSRGWIYCVSWQRTSPHFHFPVLRSQARRTEEPLDSGASLAHELESGDSYDKCNRACGKIIWNGRWTNVWMAFCCINDGAYPENGKALALHVVNIIRWTSCLWHQFVFCVRRVSTCVRVKFPFSMHRQPRQFYS